MAASQRIERGAARRGAAPLNFAAKAMRPRMEKIRPTQLANRDPTKILFHLEGMIPIRELVGSKKFLGILNSSSCTWDGCLPHNTYYTI